MSNLRSCPWSPLWLILILFFVVIVIVVVQLGVLSVLDILFNILAPDYRLQVGIQGLNKNICIRCSLGSLCVRTCAGSIRGCFVERRQ